MVSIGSDDIHNYYVGTKFQFAYYFRSRRFIGLLIFSIFITVLILFLDLHYNYSVLKTENSAEFFANYFSNDIIAFFAILAAFFGGDMISMDLGTSTAFYTLVQPIRRSVLYLGRYTAAFLSTLAFVSIIYIGAIAGSLYLYGMVSNLILPSFGFALLYMLALISFATLFSAIFKTPSIGLVVSILFLILVYPAVQGILSALAGINPWMFVTYAGEMIYLVFSKNYVVYSVTHTRFAYLYTFNPTGNEAILIMIGYIIVFSLISMIVFAKKEIKG
ncbi:ABC transporter permease [Thermoplasma sp. Kam2015]|uniref:ABC transporter permease n=1 Tax=Thermoplasma sp. Kam2015 TaxID=2094122 RepID=UPI000D87004B|nr:ABC transporter permease [Thermoplasma sp. Kam2015]PYB69072.1 ABC transporter permease [Thermoplasma sp. Kam2015]